MEENRRKVLAKRNCLVQFMVFFSLNLLIFNKTVVLCLDTKYFKRFYFGNLSVDLTEELGERFNYDYLPSSSQSQSAQLRNSAQQSSAYHSHVKQSSGGQHPHREHVVSYDGGSNAAAQPHHLHNHQGDQPVNGSSVPKTTAPPPPSNNQPYRHQDLKALSRNITNILNSFNVSYDKRVRPNYGGEAVEVGITMFVLSISDLSEVEMDFTLDFYFRQMWKDHRLTFNGPKGVNTLSVSSEFLKSMWVPDTFFVNEKTSYFHTATTNNEFLRISQTGDILRSMRLTVCASCPMDLRHFPMDSQLCTIEIESFGYTMSDIRYKWNAGAGSVGMANDVSLPQFKVYGYRQKTYEISLSTGNYSRLACEIQFVRSMGYYLIQIYIPSSLIVVISWVSFWLNRNAAPARVYLGITTVLTMTTLMSSTNKALPKISYVKSIDVYLGTCFVMVFAALLEYATVGYLAKRIQMRKNHFAALQKMALQLQNAREEHVQKQYAPTPAPQQQQAPVALPPPPQQPTTPHHHAAHPQQQQQPPTTPHTPRYSTDHYQSSSRFVDSSSLRKQYTTNNAQFSVAQQQQSHLGSTVSIPYYNAQGQQQQPPQQARPVYDSRYYDAQYNPNPVGGQAVYYQQGERAYYQQREDRGWEGGSTSRGASVKRRAAQAASAEEQQHMYMQQQQTVPPSLLQNPGVIVPHQVPVYHHHQAGASGGMVGGGIQGQQQQVVVGSVIGTTSSIEQPQTQQAQSQQQQQSQSATGDKIRQLIPINPNQICGITPSDIDKYSRVVFPVCFVCFNLLYWIIYLHISNVNPTADLVIVNSEG